MKPDARFTKQPKSFWAHVRSISQEVGYTTRGKGVIRAPTLSDMANALRGLSLRTDHLTRDGEAPTPLGQLLLDYFQYRAQLLNTRVKPLLMDAKQAEAVFNRLCTKHRRQASELPMNKQKGEKKRNAFLTGIVNILVKAHARGHDCDFDPGSLTTITRDGRPLRTLARRVDGAFPAVINPVAVWEIKEYYYTTTFGSRVADGVYETLLDGMELEELQEHEHTSVEHLLIVDSRYTWWECGRSYLCRIIDMLHMGYVDEVLFGREVVNRLPLVLKEWVAKLERRNTEGTAPQAPARVPGQGDEPKPEGTLGSGTTA